jgi:hypothetical protein
VDSLAQGLELSRPTKQLYVTAYRATGPTSPGEPRQGLGEPGNGRGRDGDLEGRLKEVSTARVLVTSCTIDTILLVGGEVPFHTMDTTT